MSNQLRLDLHLTGVVCVLLEVFDVDGSDSTWYEDLHLVVVKHAQPLNVEYIGQALAERRAVGTHLLTNMSDRRLLDRNSRCLVFVEKDARHRW